MISGLRDIHSPTSVSIWPLALGVKLVILFFSILALIAVYFFLKHWIFLRPKRIALRQLKQLERQELTSDLISQLSILMRRVALAYFPRSYVASLTGKNWLNFLSTYASIKMSQSLLSMPYQKKITHKNQAKKLIEQSRDWIKNLRVK